MNFEKLLEENKGYVKDLRRHFHMYPELSLEEFETTKKIGQELDKLSIDYQVNPKYKTGILATIEGHKPGKTLALRADIDALSVEENTQLDYSSKNQGKMHACGHDAHTAILLGAAKILSENRDKFRGKVHLIFQPAEELGQGAKLMMDFGDWIEETDSIFGGHVMTGLESGKFSIDKGPRMAAGSRFEIEIEGKSGHGSQPENTIDASLIASSIVVNLQSLVSRNYSPRNSVVVTVGTMESGSRFNIISGKARLTGTTRYFSPEIGERLEGDLRRIVENTAASFGGRASLNYEVLVPPTINSDYEAEIGRATVQELYGEESLATIDKLLGGEDFAYYLEKIPGAFVFIGLDEKGQESHPLHSDKFQLDDSQLSKASLLYAKYAINYLNK